MLYLRRFTKNFRNFSKKRIIIIDSLKILSNFGNDYQLTSIIINPFIIKTNEDQEIH